MLKISLFAGLAERTGKREVDIPIEQPVTVSELRTTLSRQFPEAGDAFHTSMVAVNQEYAGEDDRIVPSDEVAFIPPLSGG